MSQSPMDSGKNYLQSTLINRNIRVSGHRTSMRLEQSMWNALEEAALREGKTIHELCSLVDTRRSESSLTAAMRVFILSYFRAASTDIGHIRAGHGMYAFEEARERSATILRGQSTLAEEPRIPSKTS